MVGNTVLIFVAIGAVAGDVKDFISLASYTFQYNISHLFGYLLGILSLPHHLSNLNYTYLTPPNISPKSPINLFSY